MSASISALVPTLEEEQNILACLASLRSAGVDEILVIDGGSKDQTCKRAAAGADRVLTQPGGLAAQLNRGAAEATGGILLFQYADVQFPPGGVKALREALLDPTVIGGAFRLDFDSTERRYRVVARGTQARNRLGVGPFGDQSLFVRAADFRRVRGFDPEAFLSDLDLVTRLRRRGRFVLLPETVVASTRRWERSGFTRTLLFHWSLTAVHVVTGGRGFPRARSLVRTLLRVR